MATFDITSPQGQKYRVNAPEGATEQDAIRYLQRQLAGLPGPGAPEAPVSGEGLAKAGGIGLAKGAIGLLGGAGDTRALGNTLIDKAGEKFGLPSPVTTGLKALNTVGSLIANPSSAITSRDIRKPIEAVTGEFREPQNRPERYVETASSFVPSALAGPGNLVKRVATQAVIPGIASEAAGEMTAGTKYEPYARTLAAIGAGLPFGRWRSTPARPNAPAPLAEELHEAANQQYKAVRDMDLRLATQPVVTLAYDIEKKLAQSGFTKVNVPETSAVLERLQNLKNMKTSQRYVSGSDFDTALQELRQATQNRANPREAVAAWKAIEGLNGYLKNIPKNHVLQGDAELASKLFDQARGNWAAMKRLEMLGGKLELGDLNAATAHSGMNHDNAIRQAVKQLIRPNKYGKTLAEQHGFSEREIAAMNQIARGTAPINTLRYIGNLLGGGGGIGQMLLGAGGIAAGYETGHPELMGLGFLGYGARRAAGAMTERQGRRLMEDVGRRSPAGGPAPPMENDRARLLGLAGLRGEQTFGDHGPLRITVHPRPQYGGTQ